MKERLSDSAFKQLGFKRVENSPRYVYTTKNGEECQIWAIVLDMDAVFYVEPPSGFPKKMGGLPRIADYFEYQESAFRLARQR